MPSPVGHALGGIAAGWLLSGAPHRGADIAGRLTLVYAAAGMAPDLDFLIGAHRGPSHSIGAAAIAGLIALAATRRGRIALAVAAAYASHALLDSLGADTSTPVGVMALWPLSNGYYKFDAHVFLAISRRYWYPGFWVQNLRAVMREVLILAPLCAAIVYLRRLGVHDRSPSA